MEKEEGGEQERGQEELSWTTMVLFSLGISWAGQEHGKLYQNCRDARSVLLFPTEIRKYCHMCECF